MQCSWAGGDVSERAVTRPPSHLTLGWSAAAAPSAALAFAAPPPPRPRPTPDAMVRTQDTPDRARDPPVERQAAAWWRRAVAEARISLFCVGAGGGAVLLLQPRPRL